MMVVVGASLAGCATAHDNKRPVAARAPVTVSAPKPAPKPKELGGDAVKIVAHRPSAKQYKFAGRVEVRATTADIVDAALAADADLRRQAKALGADVIKLDVIAPPSDRARPRNRVILAGRAYKKSL
jgi:hypothetical protein